MPVTFPEVRAGDPVCYKSLSVFPLFTETTGDLDYILADEAIKAETLTVQETSESGSVPELLVENNGDTQVLFLEGEELVGAKQNRVLNTSMLVAPMTRIVVPVSCVEEGRWNYKSQFFGSSGSHVPSKLRYAVKASVADSVREKRGRQSDQFRVWGEVAALQAECGVQSATSAMSDTFEAYEDQLADFRKALQYVEGASGMAVTVGDRFAGCDLFDKPSTCQKVWDRLLSGFVFDTLGTDECDQQPPTADIEEMMQTARQAVWKEAAPIGAGEEFRAELNDGDHASMLSFHQTLVHGSVLTAV